MQKRKKENIKLSDAARKESAGANNNCREIAVIAAACRFPEADTPEAFWDNIVNGRCSFREVPSDRWDIDHYYTPVPAFGKTGCRTGAFIGDVYGFEPELFNIDEREAAVMDPQHRIMLELFHELIERAGYSRGEMENKAVGVYLSAGVNQFYEFHLSTLQMEKLKEFHSFSSLNEKQKSEIIEEWKNRFGKTEIHTNILADNIPNMVAARISQEFNLKGPSMVVDTACSSALVNLHLAFEALQREECDMAVAGGVNLLLTPTPYLYFSYAGALSNSGECRVFDADANGFVPGEGAGLVLLKPLDKAIADGDRILGVIKASMVNNDGRSIGVMAPNPDGQRSVIEALYKKNGLNPCDIQYVEAHGTGTTIGDPSEIRALTKAFGNWNPQKQSIAIGSVKANIGHLLNAAGIASFIKVLLALNNRKKPPVINVTTPNPLIKFEQTPFRMLREADEWKVLNGKKRTAAINSFGFGGTNCHIVLEEAPGAAETSPEETVPASASLLCVSSYAEEALEARLRALAADMENHQEYRLEDVCYTANIRQNNGKYRYSTVASSREELLVRLKKAASTDFGKKRQARVAFMFTGQGSQYIRMGKELYDFLPGFRDIVEECSRAFMPHLTESITDLIFGEKADETVLSQTGITQPVVFAMDYSIGKYMMSLGIQPLCMMGHSLGEWVAACLAGCMSLQEAAGLVALRGRLMQELQSEGSMAAVFAPAGKVEELIVPFKDRLWMGGYNITHQVVSGYSDALEEFIDSMQKNGIACKKLKVSQAFHTPLMNPMLEKFAEALAKVTFHPPIIPIISNVTGDVMTEAPGSGYWTEHILNAVKFQQSVKRARELGVNILIEAGPDKILSGMAKGAADGLGILILETQDRKKKGLPVLLNTLGNLFFSGINFDLRKLHYNSKPEILPLSTYSFRHRTFKPDFGGSNSSSAINKLFHKWEWEEEERIKEQISMDGPLLVFHDGSRKDILSDELNQHNNRVFEIVPGRDYHFDGRQAFTVHPGNSSHFKRVLENIPEQEVKILHLWNYQQEFIDQQELLVNDTILEQGTFSIIYIGKALAERKGKSRMLVVTNRMFPVLVEDKPQNPHQFTASALGLAIDQENSRIEMCVLDMDKAEFSSEKEMLKAACVELGTRFPDESLVAVRKGSRYVRKLKNMDEFITQRKLEFFDGETYLVTGGTGPVAGEICKVLAEQARLNLILTGRKVLPDREKNTLSDEDPSVSEKMEVMDAIEQAGSKAVYFPVNVNDREQMQKLIETINREFGPVNGVVHAAGLWDASSFQILSKDLDLIKEVLQPKVQGTIITDLVTRDQPLKFFATLSSVSASRKVWSAGLGDYAAANAFLNGFTYYRNSAGAPGKTIALNYSLWAEKGMVQKFGDATLLAVKAQGLNPLRAEAAASAFLHALQCEHESVVHIMDLIPTGKSTNLAVRGETALKTTIAAGKNTPPVKNVRGEVFKLIAGHLDIPEEQLDTSANFMEIGLDSLGATKVISDISRLLNLELYPTLVFEYQTAEELVRYIENTLKQVEEVDNHAVNISGQTGMPAYGLEGEVGDMAIIGMSLRVPGANSLKEYWELLKEGRCVIGDIPPERWDADEFYSSDAGSVHTMYSKKGGFIDKPYDFDPLYFGISPNEAEVMDPQQRIFLMVAWEAVQAAGYGGKCGTNRIGVFVGTEQNTYIEHFTGYNSYMRIKKKLMENEAFKSLEKDKQEKIMYGILNTLDPAKMVADTVAGNGLNEIAARVSHCLNLTGPSLIVNSACSSSLVAVHLACETLRTGQADMAIAGGVNLNLNPTPFICLSRVTALSPTGACYPFDHRADGLVLSEGAGAILLKPLEKAVKDKDFIYAVIKGSAISNDGRSQGITAPKPQGQAEAIRNAYLRSGINPETVSYIETHGTGTPLGDPIEIEGMTMAMRAFTDKKDFCGIGSVKSSIGHMLSAAGIVSLIKVVLALQNRMLTHTVNFEQPNPNIHFDNSPFYVICKSPRRWNSMEGLPRRAGVNAFGFGGTNAHVILEEAPKIKTAEAFGKPPYLLTLTGRNENIIKILASRLKDYVVKNSVDAGSVCYTMNHAQKEMSCKIAAVIDGHEELLETLKDIEEGTIRNNIHKGRSNPNRETPVYLVMMDRNPLKEELVESMSKRYPLFGDAYQKCIHICSEWADAMEQSAKVRARLFSLHYAAGVLLQDFGITPAGIYTGGTGIAAAMALTGLVSIREAGAVVCEKNTALQEQIGINPAVFGNCEVVTERGPVSRGNLAGYVQNRVIYNFKVSAGWVNSAAGKDDALIFITSDGTELKQYHSQVRFEMFPGDLTESLSEETLHKLLAGLYTCGTRFNPARLYDSNTGRIPLPTYPFEYQTYKVSFKDETVESSVETEKTNKAVPSPTAALYESKSVLPEEPLAQMDKLPDMNKEARQRYLEMLKEDLLTLPSAYNE